MLCYYPSVVVAHKVRSVCSSPEGQGSNSANLKQKFSSSPVLEPVCIKFTHVYCTCVSISKIGTKAIWGSELYIE